MSVLVPKTTCLWNNPSITIQKQELKWRSWSDKGITTIGDITSDTNVKPFKLLVIEFNLTNVREIQFSVNLLTAYFYEENGPILTSITECRWNTVFKTKRPKDNKSLHM